MPVRKVSARELLGGKSLVMFVTPAMVASFKKLKAQKVKADKAKTKKGNNGRKP